MQLLHYYDAQVLVRIAGEAEARDLAEALAWARDNKDFLARRWAELNERG